MGGIYDYLRAHNAETINEAVEKNAGITSNAVSQDSKEPARSNAHSDNSTPASNNNGRQSYEAHKAQQKKIRKAERDLESCEKKIATMEARIKELDTLFMKPENASKMELVTEYTDTKRALDEENERWFKLSEDLEAIKAS